MDNLEGMVIVRKVQSSKTEPERNRKYEKTNHKYWNWNCDLKLPTNKSLGQVGITGKFYQILSNI